jgi:demethylmenaquinone methyltransferase/2-methoxy-6-polyprenyl-1,4-benzoquinol methylase
MNNKELLKGITRTNAEIKNSYDKMSRWYDLFTGLTEKNYRNLGLKVLEVRQGEIVLEIGFGTGKCIKSIAKLVGSTGKVFGVDLSEGMTSVSQTRIDRAGLSDRVDLRCGDVRELPFGDNFFDAVYMSFVLELFDCLEIPIVLLECQRVLKPGGRICVVAMAKKEKVGLMTRLYNWAHETWPKYVDCRPIEVQKSIVAAGFKIENITEKLMYGLPVDVILATY